MSEVTVCGTHVTEGYTLAVSQGVGHPALSHVSEGACVVCKRRGRWVIGEEGEIVVPAPRIVSRQFTKGWRNV